MKILIYSQHFWPESFRINDVAQSLHAAGHEVTVLTGQPNYPGGRVFNGYRAAATGVDAFGDIEVHRVPLVPRGQGSALRLVANYLSFIASAALFGAWRLHPAAAQGMSLVRLSRRCSVLPGALLRAGAAVSRWLFLRLPGPFVAELGLFQADKVLRSALAFRRGTAAGPGES